MTDPASPATATRVPDRAPRPDPSPATSDTAIPAPGVASPAVAASGGPLHAASIVALQRLAGNRAVGNMMARRAGRPAAASIPAAAPSTPAPTARHPVIQRAISPEMADSIANRLSKAMRGWGTDEEAIYGALSGRSVDDLNLIIDKYKPLAMKGGLVADLKDELTDSEYARVKALTDTAVTEAKATSPEDVLAAGQKRGRETAAQLQEAMRGWGTDESQLLNALQGRSPHELVEIARQYKDLTGRELMADLDSELSGADLREAMGSMRVIWHAGDGPNAEIGGAQQALNALGAATPPLRVTGIVTPETIAAITAFQTAHPPLASTGELNLETWLKLDALAPQVIRNGRIVVEGPTPAEARGAALGGTIHPTVKLNARGPAVEELQQKLLTLDATQVPTRPTPNGKFEASTRKAVQEFQGSRTPPLTKSGVANKETWAALDAVAGPVTVGREDFEWRERVEGTNFGGPSRFTWRLQPDKLEITVNIKFTIAPNHAMVTTWKQQILNVWNTFKVVDADHPGKELKIEFVIGSGTPADNTVEIHTEQPNPPEIPRSNSSQWYTLDTDPGLAPHEFGHLIGLMDEYNQGPETYARITGEQPYTGGTDAATDAAGAAVAPQTIAAEIRTAVTTGAANKHGAQAAAVIGTKYSLQKGSFAQRVGQAYENANAGNLIREDLGAAGYGTVNDPNGSAVNDIAARIPRRADGTLDPDENTATAPFLYSNRSLMGEMQSLNTPISPHEHPVAERHVRHFLDIVVRNRPGNWQLKRR
jgi:peptidoglycan hydrolase-like protein with peptidoglycan-binding domain